MCEDIQNIFSQIGYQYKISSKFIVMFGHDDATVIKINYKVQVNAINSC